MKHWWNQVVKLQLFLGCIIIIYSHTLLKMEIGELSSQPMWLLQDEHEHWSTCCLFCVYFPLIYGKMSTEHSDCFSWELGNSSAREAANTSHRNIQLCWPCTTQVLSGSFRRSCTISCCPYQGELFGKPVRKVLLAFQSLCAWKWQTWQMVPRKETSNKGGVVSFCSSIFRFMNL